MIRINQTELFPLGYPTPSIEWQKADARPLSSGHIRQVV